MTDYELIVDLTNEINKYKKLVELLHKMYLYESNDYGRNYELVWVNELLEEVGLGND